MREHVPPQTGFAQDFNRPPCSTDGYLMVVCITRVGRPGGGSSTLSCNHRARPSDALHRACTSGVHGVGWPGRGQCSGAAAVRPTHPLLWLALCVLLVRLLGPHLVLLLACGQEGWGRQAQCQPCGGQQQQ